eukprot:CAMPEP_0203664816 /NCGR_PEP_ID=MMETSP0090-20130426/2155_1 /ASSEMBLY_ACC=CAM_ASM_001088 /TAXON_ID=426623 /ORGANISM="Chaetoceros affinis, Strain CCMP159" /LENGTH=470 /DNA_ID=CAMNT_0050528191 /DNA_START=142 /DNA_END=1554 /DNA_ORIENTATION=-
MQVVVVDSHGREEEEEISLSVASSLNKEEEEEEVHNFLEVSHDMAIHNGSPCYDTSVTGIDSSSNIMIQNTSYSVFPTNTLETSSNSSLFIIDKGMALLGFDDKSDSTSTSYENWDDINTRQLLTSSNNNISIASSLLFPSTSNEDDELSWDALTSLNSVRSLGTFQSNDLNAYNNNDVEKTNNEKCSSTTNSLLPTELNNCSDNHTDRQQESRSNNDDLTQKLRTSSQLSSPKNREKNINAKKKTKKKIARTINLGAGLAVGTSIRSIVDRHYTHSRRKHSQGTTLSKEDVGQQQQQSSNSSRKSIKQQYPGQRKQRRSKNEAIVDIVASRVMKPSRHQYHDYLDDSNAVGKIRERAEINSTLYIKRKGESDGESELEEIKNIKNTVPKYRTIFATLAALDNFDESNKKMKTRPKRIAHGGAAMKRSKTKGRSDSVVGRTQNGFGAEKVCQLNHRQLLKVRKSFVEGEI